MGADKIFISAALILLMIAACSKVNTAGSELNNNMDTLESSIQNFHEPDFQEVLQEFKGLYLATITLDSVIEIHDDTLRVSLNHFSLSDSILVPTKYNWGAAKFDYHVRNFASQIRVFSNDQMVVDTTVTKDAFVNLLDANLKSYGVLLYPSYQGYDSTDGAFIVNYSVSIPCTDIGELVTLRVRLDSTLTTHYPSK